MSVGALALQYVAQCVLPLLLKEASDYALKRVTRRAVDHLLASPQHAPQAPRPHVLEVVDPIQVLSDIPGRARLRVAGLHGDARGARAREATLAAQPGVLKAAANPLTGSLLVRYASDETNLRALLGGWHPGGAAQPAAGRVAPRALRAKRSATWP